MSALSCRLQAALEEQTVVALTCRLQVAPEEQSVLTLTCRPQLSFWAGPVLVEQGSHSRAVSSGLLEDLRMPDLHWKVFQERQSFDQLELQQLFLDLYRLYRPYSLSAHSWTPERSFLENVKMPPAHTL